jgi:hypothetical protein
VGTRGWSQAAANAALDKLITDYPWTKLHVGDPGANGTGNPAVNTTRVSGTWGAANVTKANSAEMAWTNVPAAEDYTDFSQWSAQNGGTFGGSGTITANPVAIGDDAKFAPGALVLTALNVAT